MPSRDPVTGRTLDMDRPADRERAITLLESQPIPVLAYVRGAAGPALVGSLIGAFTGEGGTKRAAIGAGIGAGVGVVSVYAVKRLFVGLFRFVSARAGRTDVPRRTDGQR